MAKSEPGRGDRIWGTADVQCVADGSFGHDHCRRRLAVVLEETYDEPRPAPVTLLIDSLGRPMPDDAWDELDALDLLNDKCVEGVLFEFRDGDLMLVLETEDNN